MSQVTARLLDTFQRGMSPPGVLATRGAVVQLGSRCPLRRGELTGSMSLHMVSHMPKYVSLDRTFHALADPTRRSILQLVSTGPASISELARPFGIALPTVLEHVRILEETRLLTTEKVGRVRECTLGPERLNEARQWIETFRMWERRLDGLDRYVSTRTGRRA